MRNDTFMRITVENIEPGFSDARVLIRERRGKIRLTGGRSHEILLKDGERVELTALKRTGSDI